MCVVIVYQSLRCSVVVEWGMTHEGAAAFVVEVFALADGAVFCNCLRLRLYVATGSWKRWWWACLSGLVGDVGASVCSVVTAVVVGVMSRNLVMCCVVRLTMCMYVLGALVHSGCDFRWMGGVGFFDGDGGESPV